MLEVQDLDEDALPGTCDENRIPGVAYRYRQLGSGAVEGILTTCLTQVQLDSRKILIVVADLSADIGDCARAVASISKAQTSPMAYWGLAATDVQKEWLTDNAMEHLTDLVGSGRLVSPTPVMKEAVEDTPGPEKAIPNDLDLGSRWLTQHANGV